MYFGRIEAILDATSDRIRSTAGCFCRLRCIRFAGIEYAVPDAARFHRVGVSSEAIYSLGVLGDRSA